MWFIRSVPSDLKIMAAFIRILAFLSLALIAISCLAESQPYSLEEQAYEIDRSLICPVCPGETIDQSQAALAKQMRVMVREKLADGESKEQILQFFVDRYGPMVLAEPPKKGFNLIVWIVPPIILAIGGLVLVLVVRNMERKSPRQVGVEQSPARGELESYLPMVDKEVGEMESYPEEAASSEARSKGKPE